MTTAETATDAERMTALSDEEVRSFLRRGWLLPGRLLSAQRVARLRERMDELMQAKRDSIVDLGGGGDGGKKSIPFMTGLWKSEQLFAEVAFDPRVLGWSGQLLGTQKLAFLLDNVLIKPPKVGGEFFWHQDWQAWPIAPTEVVTCWIAMQDVTVKNGAMQMAVGSHALGRFLPRDGGNGQTKTGPAIDTLRANGLKELPDPAEMGLEIGDVELKAGECSLHHGLMWHRSSANETDATRHSYILRYADARNTYTGDSFSAVQFEGSAQVGSRLADLNLFEIKDVPAGF